VTICRYCKVDGCCIPCGDCGFDAAAPELPEGWRVVYYRLADTAPWKWDHSSGAWIDLEGISALLASQGLSIVDAKDRAVLEEMLHNSIEYKYAHEASKPVAKAELARRQAKP
jgi:hypothetical protein